MSSPVEYPVSSPVQPRVLARPNPFRDESGSESDSIGLVGVGRSPRKKQRREEPVGQVSGHGDGIDKSGEIDDEANKENSNRPDKGKERQDGVVPIPSAALGTLSLGSSLFRSRQSVSTADRDEVLPTRFKVVTSSGVRINVSNRPSRKHIPFERLVAAQSTSSAPGKGQAEFYGIPIHALLTEADEIVATQTEERAQQVERDVTASHPNCERRLWTEKFRPTSFPALLGDERTHRTVLRWFIRWARPTRNRPGSTMPDGTGDGQPERRVMVLAGPAGLGKTTMAHVCARHAGFEPVEINASDERSATVVRTRIRDMLATTNVRAPGRKLCVVVDEVDGVVGGDGAGFISALLDLVDQDVRAVRAETTAPSGPSGRRRKKPFRMRRPIVLVCNDLYAPALRLLRTSTHVEIVHVRPASVGAITRRVSAIVAAEKIEADNDAIRQLCELAGSDGDVRAVMVAAEAAVRAVRAARPSPSDPTPPRLTRRFVDSVLGAQHQTGKPGRNRSTVDARVLAPLILTLPPHGPMTDDITDLTDAADGAAVVRALFDSYLTVPFTDSRMRKPVSIARFLALHDAATRRINSEHAWDLGRYLSIPAGMFRALFAVSAAEGVRFGHGGLAAAISASTKHTSRDSNRRENEATIKAVAAALPLPTAAWGRSRVVEELVPWLSRMLSPAVVPSSGLMNAGPTPVGRDTATTAPNDESDISTTSHYITSVRSVGEKRMLAISVNAALSTGTVFDRIRVDADYNPDAVEGTAGPTSVLSSASWVFRLNPAIDVLASYDSIGPSSKSKSASVVGITQSSVTGPTGPYSGSATPFQTRRMIETERSREQARRIQARRRPVGDETASAASTSTLQTKPARVNPAVAIDRSKLDFFGRPIVLPLKPATDDGGSEDESKSASGSIAWIRFNDGYSNAVRRPIRMDEFMAGL